MVTPTVVKLCKMGLLPVALIVAACGPEGSPSAAVQHATSARNDQAPEFVFPAGGLAPSGGDDTEAVLSAFADAKAWKARHPDHTVAVKLRAGRFHCRNVLVEDFHGTFRGAGKGATIIDTVGEQLIEPTPGVDEGGQWVFWFGFRRGEVAVRSLTFHPTAFQPARPYTHARWGSTQTGIAVLRMLGDEISSHVDDVEFRSEPGDVVWFGIPAEQNVTVHLLLADDQRPWWGDLMKGSHRVTRCSFREGFAGVLAFGIDSGTLVVGGDERSGNTLENIWFGILMDGSNSRFEASHNRIQGCPIGSGISARNYDWVGPQTGDEFFASQPSTFVVTHNEILDGSSSPGTAFASRKVATASPPTRPRAQRLRATASPGAASGASAWVQISWAGLPPRAPRSSSTTWRRCARAWLPSSWAPTRPAAVSSGTTPPPRSWIRGPPTSCSSSPGHISLAAKAKSPGRRRGDCLAPASCRGSRSSGATTASTAPGARPRPC